jgi:hypothetical protein
MTKLAMIGALIRLEHRIGEKVPDVWVLKSHNSPIMRGEPQVGFARRMSRIKPRTSLAMGDQPGLLSWEAILMTRFACNSLPRISPSSIAGVHSG